jgi:hypothetical protein
MAGRFWKGRAHRRRDRGPRAQGITGRALIAALASAVALVTSATAAHAQAGAAPGPSSQPPPFVEPAEKPRAQPHAAKPPEEKAAPAQPPAAKPPAPTQPPQGSAQPPQGSAQPPPAAYPPPPAQPSPAPAPYAPYPPQYPYPYAPYPPGYPPPQGQAPAYPPPAAYPPQPSWQPPAAYAPPPSAAYPPPPAYPVPAYPPPPAGEGVPTLSGYAAPPPAPRPAVVDPQGDRVILLPTATTHPAGTFYFSNYEVVVFQAGYAFTDTTQLSVTAIPVPNESVAALDISLKSSVYRGGLVRAAAIGSASGVVGKEIGLAFLGRAGAVVQLCLAQRCESSLSLSTNAVLIGTLLMVNGAGGIWRVSPHVSLLAELATMLPVGTSGGQFNGALLSGGVRLHYTHWGFDFSALHVLDSSDPVATAPFFAMTYRP